MSLSFINIYIKKKRWHFSQGLGPNEDDTVEAGFGYDAADILLATFTIIGVLLKEHGVFKMQK